MHGQTQMKSKSVFVYYHRRSIHEVARLSALGTGRLYPQVIFLVRISVTRWVDPSVGRVPSSWIEPATFWLLAQCLNQLRYSAPRYACQYSKINVPPCFIKHDAKKGPFLRWKVSLAFAAAVLAVRANIWGKPSRGICEILVHKIRSSNTDSAFIDLSATLSRQIIWVIKVNQLHSCARPYKEISCGATVRGQVSQVFCVLTTQQAGL